MGPAPWIPATEHTRSGLLHLEQFNSASRPGAADALRPCPDIPRRIDADPAGPAAVAEALAAGNRAYEEKFGQVFQIRAAGRTRRSWRLNPRLAHTTEQEQAIIGQQLREIAVLRFEGLMGK